MGELGYREFYRRNLPHFQPTGGTFFVTFRLAGSIPRAVMDRWRVEHAASLRRLEKRAEEEDKTQAGGVRYIEEERRRFALIEKYLDKAETGPLWLKDKRVADMVADSLRYRDGKVYRLDASCVMPNHVHVVFAPLPVAHAASLRSDNAERTEEPQAGSVRNVDASQTQAGSVRYVDASQTQAGSVRYVERSLASILHSLKSFTSNEANKLLRRSGQFWEHESFDHCVRDEEEWARIIAYALNNPVKANLVDEWRSWRWSCSRFGEVPVDKA
jgi:putative transposase